MDKTQEWNVFRRVFRVADFLVVEEHEKPDFLCRASTQVTFGVEVTEFFRSESRARLQRSPGYSLNLLSGGRFRHKDDRREIRVEKVIYRPANAGADREITAIILERPPISEVIQPFLNTISDKNTKCSIYAPALSAIDLVVYDADGSASCDTSEEILRTLWTGDWPPQLKQSPFREIYLVTNLADEEACIPLRANLFVAEVIAFQTMLKEFYAEQCGSMSLGNYLTLLASHLVTQFQGVQFEITAENMVRLFFASIALEYGGSSGLSVADASFDDVDSRRDLSAEATLPLPDDLNGFILSQRPKIFCCAPLHFPANHDL